MILILFLIPIIHDSLDNGLDYYLWAEHKLPMVEVRVLIETGSADDPADLPGLTYLTHRMLERGVAGNSYLELRDEIESMGAKLSLRVDREYSIISARCLSKHLPAIVKIIGQLILKPAFANEELGKLKGEVIGQIRSRHDDPFALGYDALYELIYQGHPLSHPRLGTEESVKRIGRKDILGFYHRNYLPNISAIALCGDFDGRQVAKEIKATFSDWKRGEVTELPIPEDFDSLRIWVINKPLSQAYVFLGNPGIPRRDSLFLAARLANFILGGSGLTSRLSTRIREEAGLAYIAYSSLYPGVVDHPFISIVQTRIDSAPSALKKLIAELKKARSDGVSNQELQGAKSYFLGHFPIAFDTYRERADLMVSIHRFGLGADYLDRYPGLIKSVKIKETNQMLRRILNKGFGLVVVGPLTEQDLRSWSSDLNLNR